MVELNALISLVGVLLSLGSIIALWAAVISKLQTRVDLLWEIYVADALRRQRVAGAIEARSSEKLSPKVWLDIKNKVDVPLINRMRKLVAKSKPLPANDAHLLVWFMEKMGFTTLSQRAALIDMSLEEYLANLIIYLRELERGEDSLKETLGV